MSYALIGAFSVIVQLYRLIDLRHCTFPNLKHWLCCCLRPVKEKHSDDDIRPWLQVLHELSVARLVVRQLNSVDITFLLSGVSRHHLTFHPGGPATILGLGTHGESVSFHGHHLEPRSEHRHLGGKWQTISTLAGLRLSTTTDCGLCVDGCVLTV